MKYHSQDRQSWTNFGSMLLEYSARLKTNTIKLSDDEVQVQGIMYNAY